MLTFSRKWFIFVAIVCLLLTACESQSKQGSAKDTGAYDMDSRNNEDPSLGAKSLPSQGEKTIDPFIDNTEAHYNNQLVMNRALSSRVSQIAHASSANVVVTNNNAYVALSFLSPASSDRISTKSQLDAMQINDPSSAAGIFGSGLGAKLDWSDQSALSTQLQTRIVSEVHSVIPNLAGVYVSSNPNFARRIQTYAEMESQGNTLSDYIYEFNTMVQYVFPDNANARKHGMQMK